MTHSEGLGRPSRRVRDLTRWLKKAGLNPDDMARDGWNCGGYFEFVRDEHGRRVVRGDRCQKVWREWPRGFNYPHFKWLAYRAGITNN